MGSGFLRRRKMAQIQTQVQEMQKQTEQMVNDPDGAFQRMAKPLIAQLQSATFEKNKLSALVCALLEAQGGTAVVKRGSIDQFQRHRLTILSETNPEDDGINPDVDISFSYRAEFVPQNPIDQPPAEAVAVDQAPVVPEVASVTVESGAADMENEGGK